MKKISLVIILIGNFFTSGFAQDKTNGLVTIASKYSVKETSDRLAEMIASKNLTLFARIDHAANATKQGLTLRPTELIIFGNPKAGTPLMQDHQQSGIDLPLKVLVWEDENGKAWLTYNDPAWIVTRHGLSDKVSGVVKTMSEGLKGLATAAAN